MRVFQSFSILTMFALVSYCSAQTIKHKFIAIDESRDSLVFTDENNPSTNWSVKIEKSRDIQLVGNNRVMISNGNGYAEYDLTTHLKVRDLKPAGTGSVESCRRLPNGRTLLVAEGITIWTVDSAGVIKKTVNIPNMNTFRCMRITAQNTYLLGSGGELVETDTNGTILKRSSISGANSMYMAVRMPDKRTFLSGGYGQFVAILDSAWTVKKRIGGTSPVGYNYDFFAGFQVLSNGHIVVTNWQGHGFNDGANGIGLIEYDTSGAIVWSWMDHARVSSLHAVIILDGLNSALLHDERNGIMGPVGGQVGVRPENKRRTGSPAARFWGQHAQRLFDLKGAQRMNAGVPGLATGGYVDPAAGKILLIDE
jgi:hypothetical protein